VRSNGSLRSNFGLECEATMRNLLDVICDQNPLIMPETTTIKAACLEMHKRRAGSVLVTDEKGALVGIFTGRDAVCSVLAKGKSASKTRLSEVMTRNPVTMTPNRTALDALRLMWDGGFRHVPLVDGEKIVGCVSRGDFKGLELGVHDDERELWEHMR
jgi:CBS domain-containing protein